MAQKSGAAESRSSRRPGGRGPGGGGPGWRTRPVNAGRTSTLCTPQAASAARWEAETAMTFPYRGTMARARARRPGDPESQTGNSPECSVRIGSRPESRPATAQAQASIQDLGLSPPVWTWMRKPRAAYEESSPEKRTGPPAGTTPSAGRAADLGAAGARVHIGDAAIRARG